MNEAVRNRHRRAKTVVDAALVARLSAEVRADLERFVGGARAEAEGREVDEALFDEAIGSAPQ